MTIVSDNDKTTAAVSRFFRKRENMREFCEALGAREKGVEIVQMDYEALTALFWPEKAEFEKADLKAGSVKFFMEGDEGEGDESGLESRAQSEVFRRFHDAAGVEQLEFLWMRGGFDFHMRLKLACFSGVLEKEKLAPGGRREKRE